jgi:hypothetical protein
LTALRDNRYVQRAAIAATARFLDYRPVGLSLLIDALQNRSAVVVEGAARMLRAICRNERLESVQRDLILSALAAAIRDRASRRGIYRLLGNGKDGDDAVRCRTLGRLDLALYDAMLEITGLIPMDHAVENN